MQVGDGGRDVRKGSSGFPQGRFATAARLSWSASNRIFVLFLYCRLPDCPPACRAANERSTRTMAAHNQNGCGRLAWEAGCPISVWQGQISVSFLVRDAGFDEDVSAGRFRGCAVRALCLYQNLSEDWRPMMGIGITGLSKRPGRASWLVISLLRRMCFAVETEDRFHRVPRPPSRPSRQHSWRSSQYSTVLYPYSVLVVGTALTVASRVRLGSSW